MSLVTAGLSTTSSCVKYGLTDVTDISDCFFILKCVHIDTEECNYLFSH